MPTKRKYFHAISQGHAIYILKEGSWITFFRQITLTLAYKRICFISMTVVGNEKYIKIMIRIDKRISHNFAEVLMLFFQARELFLRFRLLGSRHVITYGIADVGCTSVSLIFDF